jgi:serine/threonine protein kinase
VGKLKDWENVHTTPLGKGGQSEVFLVRRTDRTRVREVFFKTIEELSGQGLDRHKSEAFAIAAADVARADYPGELAALKKFIPRGSDPTADQSALGRLKNEIEVLKKKHTGFLKILDSNLEEGWIVTEYCVNKTLEFHLSKYKGKPLASLQALVPLIRTVADLHQDGIVHRDIKPQNIFVGDSHELLLGDFGLVFLPNLPERLSFTGESVGPRDFMPPWVFLGDMPGEIKPTFDVYMLGKVLWCMVSGKLKLHREDFLEPQLNLAIMFPQDPQMHAINLILEKCVVARERECLGSAIDLWLMAGKLAQMMENGGQLLKPEIRRLCRVCGVGEYLPEQKKNGQEHPTTSIQLNRPSGSMAERAGGFEMVAFTCNNCQHIQFFKANGPVTSRP